MIYTDREFKDERSGKMIKINSENIKDKLVVKSGENHFPAK